MKPFLHYLSSSLLDFADRQKLTWLTLGGFALMLACIVSGGCSRKPDAATESLKEEASAAAIDASDIPVADTIPKIDEPTACGKECCADGTHQPNCLSPDCHCGDTCSCHVTGIKCCDGCPCAAQPAVQRDWHEVYHGGKWWYYHDTTKTWSEWNGTAWVPYMPKAAKPSRGLDRSKLNWFGNPKLRYRGASVGQPSTTSRT